MENYVICSEIINDILIVKASNKKDENENFVKLSSFKNKSINEIFKCVKLFEEKAANDFIKTHSQTQSITLSKFKTLIYNHKCQCSPNCKKFIYGGCYNIPNVGGITVECYDRISKHGKLSPYKVVQILNKN